MSGSYEQTSQHRRETDRQGFNGWLAKWGEPQNIARLLGSFLAVIFGVFTLVIGGYAWNMKIDDRSLDNRALIFEGRETVGNLKRENVGLIKTIQADLIRIRETQIEIAGQMEHSIDLTGRYQNSLIRHSNKLAHDGQISETAKTSTELKSITARIQRLEQRLIAVERSKNASD